MRRHDREITDMEDMLAVLAAAGVCRIALHHKPYPYIVPMHYGLSRQGDRVRLYMHCAHEGEKLRLMRADPRVAFEVDAEHRLLPGEAACDYGFAYASVVGQGLLSQVEGAEKREGLTALMRQLVPERSFALGGAALASVAVLRLEVLHMTGKRRPYAP